MNRKQRRSEAAQHNAAQTVRIGSRYYTLEQADAQATHARAHGRLATALDIYRAMLAAFPRHAGIHNAQGLLLHAMGRHGEALECYRTAIGFAPEYGEAHNNLAISLQEMQRYAEALAHYDAALALLPGYAEIHYNRGVTLMHMRRYDEALASFDSAVGLQPGSAEMFLTRALCLEKLYRYEDALATINNAIALTAQAAEPYNRQGLVLQEMQRYDEALASYDKAVVLDPQNASAFHNRGVLLVVQGKMQEAEAMFHQALAYRPGFAQPLLSLSAIRLYEDPQHPDAQTIRDLLETPNLPPQDEQKLRFALGKIYDDCGWYDEAFAQYQAANRIRARHSTYRPEASALITDSIIRTFNKELLKNPFHVASCGTQPLFIVGMPRSGTTLLASILSSHPRIASAGELRAMDDCILQLQKLSPNCISYPEAATRMSYDIAAQLARLYEKSLRRDSVSGARYIIDKQPLNFRHLGLIAMLFPDAPILHCTRDPRDTLLSNYFQHFSSVYDYSAHLDHIAHFYGQYRKIMEHWHTVLPGKIIDVTYEDMVTNTESTARTALERLQLEWDECCLNPHNNNAVIATASNWQARQPVYTRSIGRWRHYEKYLRQGKGLVESLSGLA